MAEIIPANNITWAKCCQWNDKNQVHTNTRFYLFFRKALFLAFFLAFILSAPMLSLLGIPYASDGGSFIYKVHIYSVIIILLTAGVAARSGISYFLRPPVPGLGAAPLLYLLGMLWLAIYGVYQNGLGGMAYVVDTLISPGLALFLVPRLNSDDQSKLARFIASLLIFNACVALFEFFTRTHLLNYNPDPWSFRSTALMTHPLNNALILISCFPLFIDNFTAKGKLLIAALTLLALLAFGARASAVIFVIGLLSLFGREIIYFFTGRNGIEKNSFLFLYCGILLAVPIFPILIEATGIGARIFGNLSFEGASAQTRFDVYNVFDYLTLKEWLYGAQYSLMSSLREIIGVGIVENFWIGWLLQFGLVGMVPASLGLLYLLYKLCLRSGVIINVSVMMFLAASYTNNSLHTKTPALLFFLSMVVLFFLTIDRK